MRASLLTCLWRRYQQKTPETITSKWTSACLQLTFKLIGCCINLSFLHFTSVDRWLQLHRIIKHCLLHKVRYYFNNLPSEISFYKTTYKWEKHMAHYVDDQNINKSQHAKMPVTCFTEIQAGVIVWWYTQEYNHGFKCFLVCLFMELFRLNPTKSALFMFQLIILIWNTNN